MLEETIHYLNCLPGKIYTDCTLGGSGHAKAICERILPDGLLIGIDQDIEAITNARKALQSYSSNIRLFHGNFINLPRFLNQLKIDAVDGILLDLGLSLHQLENSGRGFSFNKDEPLDLSLIHI
jgi:16S rRNA (cytosine1402-N4)-methyltransferase